MNLFQTGAFTLHSGAGSSFRIECDALTEDDWAAIAAQVAERFAFWAVIGVPTGGLPFAEALAPYTSDGSKQTLIVDDVLTTGSSMEEMRREVGVPAKGVVLFARGPCPSWITPVFQMWAQ